MKNHTDALDSLSPEKRELLELMRRRQQPAPRPERPAPPRRLGLQTAPLSFAQQRLWIISQLQPENPSYNIQAALRIEGILDVAVLGRAVSEIVRRHEVLRTTYPTNDDEPVQLVSDSSTAALTYVDFEHVPEPAREAESRRLATALAGRPFKLASEPVWRAALIRFDASTHLLVFVVHHIAFDGWSRAVLISEFTKLYEAFVEGKPSPLPELAVQYADYAVWQRRAFEDGLLQAQLDYWKRQLGGSLPVLRLPTDYPKASPSAAPAASAQTRLLPPALVESLERLCRRENVTQFMLLLAAFKVLLMRYTGQAELVVGVPITNRNQFEVEGLIGFFVNALALRTKVEGDPSFRDYLQQLRVVTLEAFTNPDVPFEKLVEELQPEREADGSAFFKVAFAVQHAPTASMPCANLKLSPLEVEGGGAKLDLTLLITETERGLLAAIKYNADLFEPETCGRMLKRYETLLSAIASDPGERLSALPLMDEPERRRLLAQWSGAAEEVEAARECCHERFESAAMRRPGALAVVCGAERMTYGEFNARANRLAHYLGGRGVGPETPVAICLDRGLDMMVGLLGVLKAGGTYVPLDPAHLGERAAFILQDSKARILLTQERHLDALAIETCEVICIDREAERIERQPATSPPRLSTPDNAAYIIYTSGSTGNPKGAVIEHRGLSNVVTATIEAFDVDEDSRVLQFASINFDASIWQMFTALQAGATLYVASEEERRSGTGLVSLIERERVDTADLPPSLLGVLPPEQIPSLRTISTGGERVTAETTGRWQKGRRFFNVYGPTETTVAVTMMECKHPSEAAPPIGRPIKNASVYILDAHGQPVPEGCPGELHIGGAGVARGYLRRPGLTAEKFVPNAFSAKPGARLYRTGDWARFLPDGNLDFIGRRDRQIQLRGFRIELDEVEAIARRHPEVEEVAVISETDDAGHQRIVAYVVPRAPRELSEHDLRRYLKERLPEYMSPSAIYMLDEMPRGSAGKIDRPALQGKGSREAATQSSPPRDPIEQELVGIWSELLRLDAARIGIQDSFFDMGGHSLLAIKLLLQIERRFNVNIPFSSLFQDPTVAGLALAVVGDKSRRLDGAELDELLADIEALSEEQVEELLSKVEPE
jgi:amino acid adenylation domain-containing protein